MSMKTDELLASIEFGFDLEGFVEIVRCRLSKVVSYALLVKMRNKLQSVGSANAYKILTVDSSFYRRFSVSTRFTKSPPQWWCRQVTKLKGDSFRSTTALHHG